MTWIVVAVAVALAALTGVIIWAWRGKRVDDHPLCRRCGFDLIGKPNESARCPECGGDVSARGATTVGHRKKRLGLLAGAMAAELIVILLIASVMSGYVKRIDYLRFAPTQWLTNVATHLGDAELRRAASRELIARAKAHELSHNATKPLIDELLARLDAKAIWEPAWGELLAAFQQCGILEGTELTRFVSHYATATISARQAINVGSPLPAEILLTTRTGYPSSLLLQYDIIWRDDRGVTLDTQSSGRTSFSPGSQYCTIPAKCLQPLQSGKHTLDAEVVISVHSDESPTVVAGRSSEHFPIAVNILPKTQPVTKAITDALLNDATRQLFQRPIVISRPVARRPDLANESIQFRFAKGLPTSVAFRCLILHEGNTLREFSLKGKRGDAALGDYLGPKIILGRGPLPDTVDIILTPSSEAASETVGITSYADVELRFNEVPVSRQYLFSGGSPVSRASLATTQPTP